MYVECGMRNVLWSHTSACSKATAMASWRGVPCVKQSNWWMVPRAVVKCGGAMAHPTFHPVTENDFPALPASHPTEPTGRESCVCVCGRACAVVRVRVRLMAHPG